MVLVDSEESTNDADLFSEIESTSPATNQCSTKPANEIALQIAADDVKDVDMDGDADNADAGADAGDSDTGVGADGDFDDTEDARLDAVLLDDCSDNEISSGGPEDEEESDTDEASNSETPAASATADEMDVDEVVGTSRHSNEKSKIALPFRAGCAWSRDNWSCAYDVVFMVFFHIYRQSSVSWRDDWRRKSPGWTVQLADHFDLLLKALDSPNHSPKELSMLFSSLRDLFRDQLAGHDQQRFRRRGHVTASVCGMLELLSGSVDGPSVERCLFCSKCGTESRVPSPFALLALPVFPQNYRRETDPRFVSAGALLTRFVQSLTSSSRLYLCGTCHGRKEVRSLSVDSPWIWFEVESNHTMSPSPTVSFRLPGRHLVYDLYSVIYLGENHFTARIQDSSGKWWNYDGMWKFGAAQRNHIQIAEDFLFDGPRDAAFLIYRRSDC